MQNIVYDKIGNGYNDTRQADPYILERLFTLLDVGVGKSYLDIGCGTGNYTIALAEKGLQISGMDPSDRMLAIAKQRYNNINWVLGKAEQLDYKNQIFDGVIATLTIHHWSNLKLAFSEVSRIIKDNGRMVIFTSTPEQMKGYWLNKYFPKMLDSSINQMPSLDIIAEATQNAGLEISKMEKYFVKDDLIDHFLYVGKNRPELYLNERVRSGISSFSLLANLDEVSQGLAKLKIDMSNGNFDTIKKQYENSLGDYLFIVLEKKR